MAEVAFGNWRIRTLNCIDDPDLCDLPIYTYIALARVIEVCNMFSRESVCIIFEVTRESVCIVFEVRQRYVVSEVVCPVFPGSPRGGDVMVNVLDINQPSLLTLPIVFFYLFLSLWPFQLYFIP